MAQWYFCCNSTTDQQNPGLKSTVQFFLLFKGRVIQIIRCAYICSFTMCIHSACHTLRGIFTYPIYFLVYCHQSNYMYPMHQNDNVYELIQGHQCERLCYTHREAEQSSPLLKIRVFFHMWWSGIVDWTEDWGRAEVGQYLSHLSN